VSPTTSTNLTVAADLPPVRLRDLRHGAASRILAAGVDLKMVQETLGHSSIIVTSDTYTSVYPAVTAAAADPAGSCRGNPHRRCHIAVTVGC
jgi:integrase